MSTIFCYFGSSTKNESNEETGGFGLGAKSAWSYADQFNVITFIDGIKRYYSMSVDDTQCGEMNLLAEEPTTEPNGTLITVPVKTADVKNFGEWVAYSCAHWPVRPIINRLVTKVKWPAESNVITQGNKWVTYKIPDGKEWGEEEYNDEEGKKSKKIIDISCGRHTSWGTGCSAIVDGVFYPIDKAVINQDLKKDNVSFFMSTFNCFLQFDTGDVDVSISRETLQYNDKTKHAIIKKLNAIITEFTKNCVADVVSQPSLLMAMKVFSTYDSNVRKLVDKIKWNGHNVSHAITLKDNGMKVLWVSYNPSRMCGYSTAVVESVGFNGAYSAVDEKQQVKIIVNDVEKEITPNPSKLRNLLGYKEDPNTRYFVITTKYAMDYRIGRKDEFQTFMSNVKNSLIPHLDPIYLSTVQKENKEKVRREKRDAGIRHNVYSLTYTNGKLFRELKKCIVDTKKSDGVYVEFEANELKFFTEKGSVRTDHARIWKVLEAAIHTIDDSITEVYAIPKRFLDTFKDNKKIVSLQDLFLAKLEKINATAKGKTEIIKAGISAIKHDAKSYLNIIPDETKELSDLLNELKITKDDIVHKNGMMADFFNNYYEPVMSPLSLLFTSFTKLLKQYLMQEDVDKVVAITKQYGLLQHVSTNSWEPDKNKIIKIRTIDYINAVDKSQP